MVADFVIEKKIPIPSPAYPFKKMEVGDSFFVPQDVAGKLRSAVSNYKRHHYSRFTLRTVVEKGTKGVRIWRIK